MTDQTAIQKVNSYFESPVIRSRFSDVLSEHNSGAYIAGVLLAVANNDNLQKCTAQSIYTSALRAATMRLSVDPSTKQAHLVPYGDKATLVVGYMGLYHMAIRTGRYEYINVGKIYEGQTVTEDPITGWHKVDGYRTGNQVIGLIGAFKMSNRYGGFSKTIYMALDEIHEHAQRYSKGYSNPKGVWKTNPEAMERKTIMRLLLSRWGYLDPVDAAALAEVEQEAESEATPADFVEGEIEHPEPEPAAAEPRGEQQIMTELGFM